MGKYKLHSFTVTQQTCSEENAQERSWRIHGLRGIFFRSIYTTDETVFGAHLSVNVSQEKDSPASNTEVRK
jgi:hypothetical protein